MRLKTAPQLPLRQWKRQHGPAVAKALKGKREDEAPLVAPETHGLTPMFVPTRTEGNDFFEITSRKDFLDKGINDWLKWHSYRGLSILFGIATLWLFTVHPMLGAIGGLATGWVFGWYHRWSRGIESTFKKRDLLEAV